MITIKEEFMSHAKTRRAVKKGGADAVFLWLSLKAYCATHLTDGFISDEDMDELPGNPKRIPACLRALEECGNLRPDGTRKPGLIAKVDNGWQLHDYGDHANSAAQEEERRAKARDRKRRSRELASQHVTRDMSVTERDGVSDIERDGTRDKTRDLGRSRVPNPTQPNLTKDLEPDPSDLPGHSCPTPPQDSPIFFESSLVDRACELLKNPAIEAFASPKVPEWPEVAEICDVFSEVWGRSDKPRHAGDVRSQKLLERFAEGYTTNDLKRAVRGAKSCEHISGNRSYQSIKTILRDGAQVDKFLALWREGLLDQAKSGAYGDTATRWAKSGRKLDVLEIVLAGDESDMTAAVEQAKSMAFPKRAVIRSAKAQVRSPDQIMRDVSGALGSI